MDICITCINKYANNTKHYLKKCKFNNLTICNICNRTYLNGNYFGHCSLCYFNCCEECLLNESWIRKSPFHNHLLILCNTNRLNGWICDRCNLLYDKNESSFYCTECDIDICKNCINENLPLPNQENKKV